MPLPNLIHPVAIKISKTVKASTIYDDDVREPVRSVSRTEVTINAQVSMTRTRAEPEFGGQVVESVGGYLLMRVADLTAKSYSPAIGDKITDIGHRSVQLYILQTEDLAHYGDESGATLVKAYFEDRRPAAGAPSMIGV